MKHLVLTSGLVGVGKSTVAKAIAQRLGGHFVDVDDFKKSIVDSVKVKEVIDSPEVRWVYYEKALEHVIGVMSNDKDSVVVIDEVFHLATLRSRIESFCSSVGITVLWVEVKSPFGTVKRRLEGKGREGHILSTEEALTMHLMFKEVFEPFNLNDNYICLNNDRDDELPSFDDVVKRICG